MSRLKKLIKMLAHDQKPYFVENIIKLVDEKNPQRKQYLVGLLYSSNNNKKNEKEEPDIEFEIKYYDSIPRIKNKPIIEGQYIFVSDNGTELTNGNGDKFAKQQIFLNAINRKRLEKRNAEKKSKLTPDAKISKIASYHINVGHGNCSIIVIISNRSTLIWMVDCSNKEKYNGDSYTKNIEECISYLKTKYSLSKFHIDKFFLTHTHFDHYSGMLFLINNGYIDKNTECYLNLHYQMASRSYNEILTRLTKIRAVIIEPIINNSNEEVKILHPLMRTYKSNKNIPGTQFEPYVNNSSVVYLFNLGDKSILFPGDIETEGWDRIAQLQLCLPNFKMADYICVSHHGSINGHLRTHCSTNVANCKRESAYAILMGRNGAYPGIYSNEVINSFGSKLIYSQWDSNKKKSKFLEIEWDTNIFFWHPDI